MRYSRIQAEHLRHKAAGLIAAGLLCFLPATVQAATDNCAAYDDVLGRMADKYGETPVAHGRSLDGRLVQILASPDRQTWTIVVASPDQTTCVALAGEAWQPLQRTKARVVTAP